MNSKHVENKAKQHAEEIFKKKECNEKFKILPSVMKEKLNKSEDLSEGLVITLQESGKRRRKKYFHKL